MNEAEIERILKSFAKTKTGRKQPQTIAKDTGESEASVLDKLKELEKRGFVGKCGSKSWRITSSGASVIGVELPGKVKETMRFDIKDLIIESRESLLNVLRDSVEEIIGEIRKLSVAHSIPSLSEFERAIQGEYLRLYVESINAVRIPELRRSIKMKLHIDNDIFDELLIKLFESGKYKIEEGSGDDGLRFRGRNFMFLKKR